MIERYDRLGRRIPTFDRSAANKKVAAKTKEKHGKDFHSRIGANGGSHRKRGYFGILKDEGKTDELKAIAHNGAVKSNEVKAQKKKQEETTEGDEGGV